MKYDNIKDLFADTISVFPQLRVMFYSALDMLLLRQKHVKKIINKYFQGYADLRFYDAGAGFGQYSYFILKNWDNAKIHAVDLKTDYMDSFAFYAKAKGWNSFQSKQADLQLYTPDSQFDLVIAIDILEHITNDRQVLQNFRKVLAVNGKLVISSPSNFDESAKFTAEHVRPGYSKEEIMEKLETAGFTVKEFKYTYGKWGQISWKLIMKYPLTILGKSKLYLLLLPLYYLFTYPMAYMLMQLDLHLPSEIGNGILIVAE